MKTYTRAIRDLDDGRLPKWANMQAPDIGKVCVWGWGVGGRGGGTACLFACLGFYLLQLEGGVAAGGATGITAVVQHAVGGLCSWRAGAAGVQVLRKDGAPARSRSWLRAGLCIIRRSPSTTTTHTHTLPAVLLAPG